MQARRGAVADFAISYTLPRLIGFERAFEMIVGGVRISGETAGQWGLASRVVAGGQVLETALALARDVALSCSPLVMGMHKTLLWQGQHPVLAQYIGQETRGAAPLAGEPRRGGGRHGLFRATPAPLAVPVNRDWPDFQPGQCRTVNR